ncbi:MAG: response regulator [Aliishimia sp.]
MAQILLIDDDIIYLDALANGLAEIGHDVVTALSGPDAISVFLQGNFDIAICDVIMSGGGALSFLHEVRAHKTNFPVIVITGRSEIASSPLFLEGMRDASAKIEKTASLTEIDELVQSLLA